MIIVFHFHLGDGSQPPIGVTVTQLYDLIKSRNVTMIDVRNPWELRQEGKIAGSINIPGNKTHIVPNFQAMAKFNIREINLIVALRNPSKGSLIG